jgi:glutamine amidotransferase
MRREVTVIDYGRGNLHSLVNALTYLGCTPLLDVDGSRIHESSRLILPGVGAFGEGMRGLDQRGQRSPLINFSKSGRPVLGICLGCQMLLSSSEEFGSHGGLGLIPGRVVRIQNKGERIPNVGWKPLELQEGIQRHSLPFCSVGTGIWVYFVHSFHAIPDSPADLMAVAPHGDGVISAVIGRGNIFGFQFHPEKSGEQGLQMIEDFLKL